MSEQRCGAPSLFRYTWPGKDEVFVCVEHAAALERVVKALDFHLQLVMLLPDQLDNAPPCTQVTLAGKDRDGVSILPNRRP